MDIVNLMFLAMAGMAIFLGCTLISNWARSRHTRHEHPSMSQLIPPRKRTVSGQAQARDAAVELSHRMSDWQSTHPSASRPSYRVTSQASPRAAKLPSNTGEQVPRLH